MADTNTVVGQTILIKGNLEGEEDLTVQGRIEGSLHLTKTLIVEPSGIVKAEISVCNAIISGIMVGNLTATDSVEITETGRMVGDIRAPRVIITEGAVFKGQVDMGDLGQTRSPSETRKPLGRITPVLRSEPSKKISLPAQSKPITASRSASSLVPVQKVDRMPVGLAFIKAKQSADASAGDKKAGHAEDSPTSPKKKVIIKKKH
jgi:Integral membrane protein CcmA involved in cell shape determination